MKFKKFLETTNESLKFDPKDESMGRFDFPSGGEARKFAKGTVDFYKNHRELESYEVQGSSVVIQFASAFSGLRDEITNRYQDTIQSGKDDEGFKATGKDAQRALTFLGDLFTRGRLAPREVAAIEYKRGPKGFVMQDKGNRLGGVYATVSDKDVLTKAKMSADDFEKFLVANGATKAKKI
jgi:hypothetical protein